MNIKLYGIYQATELNNEFYFVPKNGSLLFKFVPSEENRVYCLCNLNWNQQAVICLAADNNIWCISYNDLKLVSYNVTSKEIECYENGKYDKRENIFAKIMNGKIYIFPRDLLMPIVVFDIECKTFSEQNFISEKLKCQISKTIVNYAICDENILYMLLRDSNILITYYIVSENMACKRVPYEGNLTTFTHFKDDFWFVSSNRKEIVHWRNNDDKVDVDIVCKDKFSILNIYKINNDFLLSEEAGLVIYRDSRLYEISTINATKRLSTGSHFKHILRSGDIYYFFPFAANGILTYDCDTGEYSSIELKCSIDDWIKYDKILREEDLDLSDYIKYVGEVNEN